jgi:VanZ family protein
VTTKNETTTRVALSWLPVLSYTALIWVLSSRALNVRLNLFPFQDKGVHFLEYGLLAFLVTHAVQMTWPKARYGMLVAFLVTVSLGATDELHQAFVPGRSADVFDLVADALGALTAIVLYNLLRSVRQRREALVPRERSSEESL